MPSFGKRVDVPGGRRRTQRQQVALAASAIALDGSRSVVIDNLCTTGARLRGRNIPAQGKQLVMKVGEIELLASVAWAGGQECGVTFDVPLCPDSLALVKQEGQVGRLLGII